MLRAALLISFCFAVALPQETQDTEPRLERVTTGFSYASALAWVSEQGLLIADLPAGHLRQINSQGTSRVNAGLHAAGLAVDNDGRLWASDSRSHRVVRFDRKGKMEVLASGFEGKPFNGPADIALTRNGLGFVADPAWARADEAKKQPFYGIYRVTPKGEVSVAVKLSVRPNGLAIAPDGRTLYATIADTRTVKAWNLSKNGDLSEERVFAKDIEGVPDGVAVGPDGKVYVAARDVIVYSADGERDEVIAVPEKATDCEFGEGGGTLFISTEASLFRWQPASKGERH